MRKKLETLIKDTLKEKYEAEITVKLEVPDLMEHGDFAFPCFPLAKSLRKAPQMISADLKATLDEKNIDFLEEINNVGPYLNFKIRKTAFFSEIYQQVSEQKENYGKSSIGEGQSVMIEFSSPNTNKPLHLGHIRNNLLGDAISRIFAACSYKVIKANLLNDRGIHICKAMLAWQKFGEGKTPESTNTKGDHFVGAYYVIFEQKLKEEEDLYFRENNIDLTALSDEQKEKAEAEFYDKSKLMHEAREMLIKWEQGDTETLELWKKMNEWTVQGHNETYNEMGVSFDKFYYESETYTLGKETVLEGLKKGVCYQKEDGSVWLKLPEGQFNNDKILLRKDGTSVYITQDIGTAMLKYKDFHMDRSVYVVASEQEYQFRILFKALELLGFEKYAGCYHLSYGMVYLPEGKMKSREGKVVDADDLITEMRDKAREEITQRNRPFSGEELKSISNVVGLGALKYYILQYSAKTDFTFDPKASIDFNGKTGPYIQYTHARISSLLKFLNGISPENADFSKLSGNEENTLLRQLEQFTYIIEKACNNYNTSILAEYLYDLASTFNTFYSRADNKIREMSEEEQKPRLALAHSVRTVLSNGLNLLGIEAPEQM